MAQTFSPTVVIILGDFNTGNIFLDRDDYARSTTTSFDIKLKDALDTMDLVQIIDTPTIITDDTANLRDLIITDNKQIIANSGLLSPFSNIDHIPVTITLNIDTVKPSIQTKYVWDYQRLDADKLTQTLIHVDWDQVIDGDVYTATERFTSILLDAATDAIPKKTLRIRKNDKPWITSELRRNIRKRDRLFRQAQRRQRDEDDTQDDEDAQLWDKWKRQRNLVTGLNKRLRNDYIQATAMTLLEYQHDPYKYHQTLKSLVGRKQHNDIPTLETMNGDLVTDEKDKANILNEHFASQSKLDTHSLELPGNRANNRNIPMLQQITVSREQVLNSLNSLNIHKSTGPDQISTKLLKLTALLIYEPLTKLFNKSLALGIFPNSWKNATVTKTVFTKTQDPHQTFINTAL